MSDTHEVREAREREARSRIKQMVQQDDKRGRAIHWLIKLLDERLGLQGETIHRLRAELAEVRELNYKVERGELRRLERFEETAKEQFELDEKRLMDASEYIRELREKLAAAEETTSDAVQG